MNDVVKGALTFGAVGLIAVGGATAVVVLPVTKAKAAMHAMTGERCVEHCTPLAVKRLDAEGGCVCVARIEVDESIVQCERFCGVREARWLMSADMGFLCTCESLPNLGVCPVPPLMKRTP